VMHQVGNPLPQKNALSRPAPAQTRRSEVAVWGKT
jgi:hypothetical protein